MFWWKCFLLTYRRRTHALQGALSLFHVFDTMELGNQWASSLSALQLIPYTSQAHLSPAALSIDTRPKCLLARILRPTELAYLVRIPM